MLQNARVTAFTFSELVSESQQGWKAGGLSMHMTYKWIPGVKGVKLIRLYRD